MILMRTKSILGEMLINIVEKNILSDDLINHLSCTNKFDQHIWSPIDLMHILWGLHMWFYGAWACNETCLAAWRHSGLDGNLLKERMWSKAECSRTSRLWFCSDGRKRDIFVKNSGLELLEWSSTLCSDNMDFPFCTLFFAFFFPHNWLCKYNNLFTLGLALWQFIFC